MRGLLRWAGRARRCYSHIWHPRDRGDDPKNLSPPQQPLSEIPDSTHPRNPPSNPTTNGTIPSPPVANEATDQTATPLNITTGNYYRLIVEDIIFLAIEIEVTKLNSQAKVPTAAEFREHIKTFLMDLGL